MFIPNMFTMQENGKMYGLHRFAKDSEPIFSEQHSSGEWFTHKPASARQVAVFERCGTKAVKQPKTDKTVDSSIMTENVMTSQGDDSAE